MRPSTIFGVAALALSSAVLAQASRGPVEPKNEPYANMVPANAAGAGNTAADNATTGNDLTPIGPDTKTEPAAPRQ